MNNAYKPNRMTITNGLIISYAVIYLLQMFMGVNESIYRFGLNGILVTQNHEYYRLFLNEFMHGSLLHFLMNSMFIYQIGNIIEQILGKSRYVFVIFLSIFFADLASIAFDLLNPPGSIGIGASGFAYGLIGLLAAFSILYPGRYYRQLFTSLMRNILFYSMIFLFMNASIGWSAHIGGFLGGLIAGAILHAFFRKPQW